MRTILVTGATGFLGRHLVERLNRQEPEARLRLMSRSPADWSRCSKAEPVLGDIAVAADVQQAAEGADEIYHLAGFVEREPKSPWPLFTTHIEGTRNVCEAALAGSAKVVLVSSSGTFAVSRDPVIHDESAPYAYEAVREWPYYLSKIYAEKLALHYSRGRQLPLVVVNPSLLLGPGDERKSSTHDIDLYLKGQITAIPTGGLNLVDVRDAAEGTILAMRRGQAGERYLLTGPNWTFREWAEHLAPIAGRRPPRLSLPVSVSMAGAKVMRKLLPLVGGSFDLDDASIKMSAIFWYADSAKARTELGFTTRDPADTLRDTVEYLRRSS